VTLLTLSNVALKIDPKVSAELLLRATTITQPDAMNSTEANQTPLIICEVNYVPDVWAERDTNTERITASETQEFSQRNPPTSAREFLSQSLSSISFSTQKFFASQVHSTWLAVSQGRAWAFRWLTAIAFSQALKLLGGTGRKCWRMCWNGTLTTISNGKALSVPCITTAVRESS
jgi:hypothetical protein